MSIQSSTLPRFIGAAVIVIGLVGPSLAQGSAFLARADASLVINDITPSGLESGVDVLVDSGVTEIAPRLAVAGYELDIVDDLETFSIAMGTFVDGQIGDRKIGHPFF
jgi:hypothetical protein